MRIVFDLDGTLIDSAPDIRGIANALLAERGCAPLALDETRAFIGDGAAAFVERMRGARGLPASAQEDLLARFVAAYEDAVGLTRLYPGARAALDALAGAGHRLGICTNKPHRATLGVLRHFDLLDLFGAVIGGDSLPTRKPDPAPLRRALDALGEGACVYVGDSDVDAETARRAGVRFLLYTEGYRKSPVSALPHHAAFSEFNALPGLVAAAG